MTRVLAAIVVPPHLSASGGARAGRALSEALAQHLDVTIASMSRIDASLPGHARTRRVRTRLPAWTRLLPAAFARYRSLFYRSDIPAIVAAGGWDLVHLHNPTPALELARIARACRRARIPYVISTHGFNEIANGETVYGLGLPHRLAWRATVLRPIRGAVRGAAAVFALSPADTGIVRAFGFAGPIPVVPNGVPTPPPPDDAADRAAWARLGVLPPKTAPGPTCMFLGNHTPNKGVPVLLRAFAALRVPYQLIVGGENRDGIDYAGAQAAAGPGQRVVITGRLTDAEVGALLRRTDLFVFPTLADTFPLVVLEAMAHGCAVLASDVGGIPYQLANGCGALSSPGDVPALTAALTRLLAQPRELAAMGEAGRARVAAAFTWDAAAAQALDGYRLALAAAPGPSARSVLPRSSDTRSADPRIQAATGRP